MIIADLMRLSSRVILGIVALDLLFKSSNSAFLSTYAIARIVCEYFEYDLDVFIRTIHEHFRTVLKLMYSLGTTILKLMYSFELFTNILKLTTKCGGGEGAQNCSSLHWC